jgi:antitoxin CptB
MMNGNNKNAQQRRLAWRCRRGMLELDIVLQRFVSEQFDTLTSDELQIFDGMLDLPDNDFWALISSANDYSKNVSTNAVITKLKAVRPKHI